MRRNALVIIAVVLAMSLSPMVHAQGAAYLSGSGRSYAIDAQGKGHNASDYPGQKPPWMSDLTFVIGPAYPYRARNVGHQGAGLFQLILDLQKGSVVRVQMVQGTGFQSLDDAAIDALRQWRFKPNKWKEVYMPVSFTLGKPLRAGAKRIPSNLEMQ